jgi:ParB family chromosome partitioning protein
MSTITPSKPRLGRGLDALITGPTPSPNDLNAGSPPIPFIMVPIGRLQPNPYQPRKNFDEDELLQLAESLRTHGMLQPITARETSDGYELIAGERRLRAAQLAGLLEVPVHVVAFDDQQTLEAALVENIQRADLNPIEKAQGFKEYLDRFKLTQEQLSHRIGIDRSSISNLINLLNLPNEVQEWVRMGQITLGHAKVLKGLADPERQITMAKEVIAKNLSVHALELVLKQQRDAAPEPAEPKPAPVEKTRHVESIEDELRQRLATRVAIKMKGKAKGQIVIGFENNDDFERVLELLRR